VSFVRRFDRLLVTELIGYREQSEKDIRKERLTDLDRNMLRNSQDYVVDLSATPENYQADFDEMHAATLAHI